jgi:cell division protein FtsB
MNKMNNYIGDELANKVRVLSQALARAEKIIATLEEENDNLKDVLMDLASENNKDLVLDSEALCV